MSGFERVEAAGAGLSIWRDCVAFDGLRTAALGAFRCDDAAVGAALLEAVALRLAAEGFGALLGPMNGDTWAAYRFVVESDGRPPFPMEPTNPPHYPEAFELAGFEVVSRYRSSVYGISGDEGAAPLPEGLALQPFDPADADASLRALHRLSLHAFAENHFYAPVAEDRFFGMYRPALPLVDPDLLLLAVDGAGELQGFLFGLPGLPEGPWPRTVVLKTYATRRKGEGLGSALASIFHERAAAKGYATVIHALMHEENVSVLHSAALGAEVFRRYALWGRRL